MRVGDLVYIPFIDDKGTLTKGILTTERGYYESLMG